MSELTLFLVRIAYLAILWIFVLSAISVIRSDMFGARVPAPAAPGKQPRAPKPPPAPRRGQPTHVAVVQGVNTGVTADLANAPVLIGRGNDAAIRLDDDYVSTRHARIVSSGGQWYVEDLGSTNGTYLGSQRITQPVPIGLGSQVRIGKTIVELEEVMAPTPDGTPDPAEDLPLEDSPLDSTAPDTVENPEVPERPAPDPTAEVPPVFQQDTVDAPVAAPKPPLSLDFYAVSDVGRVRKDNQDSGYAGPWLLSVCDGVGGAARGDIASGTAINELRQLDEPPGTADVLDRVSDGIHEAHVAIGNQVDQDPSLNGTSTTATVALFDGTRLALGHVGDSRAYLLRDGELSQLTSDHTFVQSLIDEGRITAEEARVHPHRNLILKALDGLHDVEPDLFALELVAGDRLFLCSDGACGVLDDPRITEILSDGSPEFSSIEMVRASLDAGSSDNVTCVVADVAEAVPDAVPHEPMIVGAAADLRQRRPRALFRGHRSGDTGELEPVTAEIPEGIDYAIRADPPADPEAMRYAPQAPPRFIWPRRLLALAVLVGLVWVVLGSAYWWSQRQYYVGEDDGSVVIYRGVEVPGLSSVHEVSDIAIDDLPDGLASSVEDGIPADDYAAARDKLEQIAGEADQPDDTTDTSPEPSTTPDPTSPPAQDPSSGGASDFAPVE